MDSMRSLNTSLPRAYSTRVGPPEELLQAFRTAALSVTNLYKAAVTDQNSSRQAGYQEALEDLLNFLDRENLGLQDGEGWRVRQWATERFDGSVPTQTTVESDDERSEDGRNLRPAQTSQEPEPLPQPQTEQTIQSSDNEETSTNHESISEQPAANPTPIFHFTGLSSNHDSDDMQTEDNSRIESSIPSSSPAPIRVEVVNKPNRVNHRQANSRHSIRSSNREFTTTAGAKRKMQFPDFFDISDTGPREGHGNSKRGRFI